MGEKNDLKILRAVGAVREELQRFHVDYNRSAHHNIAGVTLTLKPKKTSCPVCLGPTKVQKTKKRHILTCRHGPLNIREVILICPSRCRLPSGELAKRQSEMLAQLVAPGDNFGYDIEVFVGIERFLHFKQRQEIHSKLINEYHIPISPKEVSILAFKFLEHLESLHRIRSPKLKEAQDLDGGYPLHIDTTLEEGRSALFIAYAGWRSWVLGAWKITTEREELITPCLGEIRQQFGTPKAIMRDLGKAVILAAKDFVKDLHSKVPVLSCHQHFLKDIGKDLLNPTHEKLRKLFYECKVTRTLRTLIRQWGRNLALELPKLRSDFSTWAHQLHKHNFPKEEQGLMVVRSLAQWVLDYQNDGNGNGFPFDQPNFDYYKRCVIVHRIVNDDFVYLSCDKPTRRALMKLKRILDPVATRSDFARIAKILSKRVALFNELRGILRLDPQSSKIKKATPPLPEKEADELDEIATTLDKWTLSLKKRLLEPNLKKDYQEAIHIILKHLLTHGESLWGHAIQLGDKIRLVARTNNNLEGFFKKMKHSERRRSGHKNLTQDFDNLPAAAALAYNLNCPDYVKVVCGSLEQLPEVFAELDSQKRLQTASLEKTPQSNVKEREGMETASLSRPDRKFIRSEPFKHVFKGLGHPLPSCSPTV